MQLTIQDGILCVITPYKIINIEMINNGNVVTHFITCGYRISTAQAIAYGILSDRNATILLAQLVRLLQSS